MNEKLHLSRSWRGRMACPKCHASAGELLSQLEQAPERTSVRCEQCGEACSQQTGVINFGVRDSFYDEHGFDSIGRDFSRSAFGGFLLYLARRHFLYDISQAIPEGAAVVEVGCGGGSRYLASRYDILGIEISERALANLSRTYPSVVQASVAEIPLSDGCAEAVISSFVLEHLGEDTLCQSLCEMARVLKSGGLMLHFLDLDSEGPFSLWAKKHPWYERVFVQGKGHFGLRALQDWRKLFEDNGLVLKATRLSCKSWLQDLSVWSMMSDPIASGLPRQVGKLADELRRRFNPAADLIVGAVNDLLDPMLPDDWATKAIVTLEKRA